MKRLEIQRDIFDPEFYYLLAYRFAQNHPTIVANNDIPTFIKILSGEWGEIIDESRKSTLEDPQFELLSELADFTFGLFFLTAIHLPEDFNYERSLPYFSRKMTLHHSNEVVPDLIKSLADSRRRQDSLLTLLVVSYSLVLQLPEDINFNNQYAHTAGKNENNYPTVLHTAYHPWTDEKLSTEGLRKKYRHVAEGSRLIRKAAGRPRNGMSEEHWQPHQTQLENFENSRQAIGIIKRDLSVYTEQGYYQSARASV